MADKKNKITTLKGSSSPSDVLGNSYITAGTVLSLNMKRRVFFGVPGFELTPSKPTETVPAGIGHHEMVLINEAVGSGELVKSENYIPKITKNLNRVKYYISKLNEARDTRRDLYPHLYEISQGRQEKLGNYSSTEMVHMLMQHELENQCRQAFITFLQFALDNMPGHSIVKDSVAPAKVQRDIQADMVALREDSESAGRALNEI